MLAGRASVHKRPAPGSVCSPMSATDEASRHELDGDQLREAAVSGVRWFAIARVATEALQLASAVALARLVSPADFGNASVALDPDPAGGDPHLRGVRQRPGPAQTDRDRPLRGRDPDQPRHRRRPQPPRLPPGAGDRGADLQRRDRPPDPGRGAGLRPRRPRRRLPRPALPQPRLPADQHDRNRRPRGRRRRRDRPRRARPRRRSGRDRSGRRDRLHLAGDGRRLAAGPPPLARAGSWSKSAASAPPPRPPGSSTSRSATSTTRSSPPASTPPRSASTGAPSRSGSSTRTRSAAS